MIAADSTMFPQNVQEVLLAHLQTIDIDLHTFRRPLKATDPNNSIGVHPMQWQPVENSFEMMGRGRHGPSLNRYTFSVMSFVKDMGEERGLAAHNTLAHSVRTMLLNHPDLDVSLGALTHMQPGVVERAQRWGVTVQRLASNEVNANWLYLSTLEFYLETETS